MRRFKPGEPQALWALLSAGPAQQCPRWSLTQTALPILLARKLDGLLLPNIRLKEGSKQEEPYL